MSNTHRKTETAHWMQAHINLIRTAKTPEDATTHAHQLHQLEKATSAQEQRARIDRNNELRKLIEFKGKFPTTPKNLPGEKAAPTKRAPSPSSTKSVIEKFTNNVIDTKAFTARTPTPTKSETPMAPFLPLQLLQWFVSGIISLLSKPQAPVLMKDGILQQPHREHNRPRLRH